MKIIHLMAGLGAASGVANIARRFVRVQRGRGDVVEMFAPAFKWNPIYFGLAFSIRAWWNARTADEVWVHCSWTFPVWFGAFLARLFRKKLVVIPEGSFDPKRLNNHAGWKKRLVAPLDRWVLRRADEVLALCRDEITWVKGFEPSAKVRFEQVPIFLPKACRREKNKSEGERLLHVLFLGRAKDPLKGVEFLEGAVAEVGRKEKLRGGGVELRIVSGHFGEELEKDWEWCDVLVLPTLSENFGLVVAEALEHCKRVITTDGAPAWKGQAGVTYLDGYVAAMPRVKVDMLTQALSDLVKYRGAECI